MSAVYLDTSVLAKWYLPEPRSDEAAAFIEARAPAVVSTLSVVELRSLLSRRRRAGQLDALEESKVFATFEEDAAAGHVALRAVPDAALRAAVTLIARLPDHPLRTLDALHLAMVLREDCTELATADRVMAAAAEALGLVVHRFD